MGQRNFCRNTHNVEDALEAVKRKTSTTEVTKKTPAPRIAFFGYGFHMPLPLAQREMSEHHRVGLKPQCGAKIRISRRTSRRLVVSSTVASFRYHLFVLPGVLGVLGDFGSVRLGYCCSTASVASGVVSS
jgi:hypothetical protein